MGTVDSKKISRQMLAQSETKFTIGIWEMSNICRIAEHDRTASLEPVQECRERSVDMIGKFENLFMAFMALPTTTKGYWDLPAAVFVYLRENGLTEFSEWLDKAPTR